MIGFARAASAAGLVLALAGCSAPAAPAAPARRPASVRSVRIVPDAAGLGCRPAEPPPEVLVEVDPGDHRPAGLTVTVLYDAGERFSGDVPAPYDAGRGVFAARLPAVTRDLLPPDAVMLSVTARVVPGDDRLPPFAGVRLDARAC